MARESESHVVNFNFGDRYLVNQCCSSSLSCVNEYSGVDKGGISIFSVKD